ncbi:MAG: CBS domain-containing protein [Gammaproteobacteria bacterium]|nr:CBS domain-containing protein [Gammaproteobacteria bacterium]
MELSNLVIATGIARPGMTVGEVFSECVRADVPGIPFQAADGRITGKVSIRHILKETCIPHFMVKHAHLLGDDMRHLGISKEYVSEVLALEIDEYVLPKIAVVNSNTAISKALAVMEGADTSYLFVMDDGTYRGVVSIVGIARTMLESG